MEYDENKVLTDYIWSHAYEYMTDLEKLSYKAVNARFKAENASQEMAKVLLEKWGGKNDPRVNEALSQGVEPFREAVRDRILRDHPEIVNRCPECGKIVRTPRAKQCNWCFYDWHVE
jgi:hypothetical protein